jgi:DNA-binding transcriptional regulator LsrR (DeoR family)
VQHRHRAWRLVNHEGRTIDEAAQIMGLPAARVRVLVAHERDRLELVEYRIDSIPTERARSFLDRELERNPTLTRAEIAHRMNMDQVDLDRQLGYAKTKTRNGAKQTRVGIPLASRLTLALGRSPNELDGC